MEKYSTIFFGKIGDFCGKIRTFAASKYKGYEKDKNNSILKTYSLELVNFLLDKYHPDNYSFTGDNTAKLQYCIIFEITLQYP